MGMRNFIAGLAAVLGTVLILGGAWIIARPALAKRANTEDGSAADPSTESGGGSLLERGGRRLSRIGPTERLILWGMLLLLIAAIVVGAVGFNLNANATGR
jgi:hypothetical protein